MLNNFLWTFAKFKTRNFALFSVTLRREALGLNLVLSWARLEPRGWEGNTWSGLTTASCIPYSAGRPHLISSFPHELFAPRPAQSPWLGSKTRVSLCAGIISGLWVCDLAPAPGADTWDERKRKLQQPTWAGSFSQIHFLICCSKVCFTKVKK